MIRLPLTRLKVPAALFFLGGWGLTCCPSRRPSQPSRKESSGKDHASTQDRATTTPSDGRPDAAARKNPATGHRAGATPAPEKKPATPELRATRLLGDGKLEEAAEVVTRALTESANTLALHVLMARIRISQNRYADAVKAAEKAIALSPQTAQPHGLAARAHMLNHRPGKALKNILSALAVEPNRVLWHRMLGQCHLDRGKLRDGLKALNRALELDRHSAWTRVLKADTLWRLDLHNEAAAEYRQASRLAKDGRAWQAEALDRLATLLKSRRKTTRAFKVLKECQQKFPEFGCPYAEAALMPPDPTQPERKETFVKPPARQK